jgi:hypothetical protein
MSASTDEFRPATAEEIAERHNNAGMIRPLHIPPAANSSLSQSHRTGQRPEL